MLIALADPAATVPPTSVASISPIDGIPWAASIIAGIVVISSSTMIRGLVRRTYAVIVSRSEPPGAGARSSSGSRAGSPFSRACTASRRDTVASATSVAQIRTDSATCNTTAHGRSRENTFNAPETICPTNRQSASVDSTTRSLEREAIVRARIATQSTSRKTPAASTRCANIAVAAPPSAGTSRPFISGQSVNASPAERARTYVPTSRSAPVAPTVNNVSRAKPASPPADPFSGSFTAQNAFAATKITSATNASATAKCAVTHHGFRSVWTTMPPRTAWPITSGNAAVAGHTSDGMSR